MKLTDFAILAVLFFTILRSWNGHTKAKEIEKRRVIDEERKAR